MRIRDALFPLTLLAFAAVGVRYWNIIFNGQSRWLFLAILLLVVIIRRELTDLFFRKSGIVLGAYLLWCLVTVAWSEEPELSLLKVVAFVMTVAAFIGAGQAWTFRNSSLGFLLPVVVLTLFAGLFDRGAGQGYGDIKIYGGLTGNANYLGAIAAMSIPYALWQTYKNRKKRLPYFVAMGGTAALCGILWLSASRSSILCTLAIVFGFLMALRLGGRVIIIGLVGIFALSATIAVPAVKSSLYERLIVKGDEEGGALVSRQQVWAESYGQALKGGLFGGGYGVTIGSTSAFSLSDSGFTAVAYGREKGNAQLAIWEETGLVGLTLYGAFVLAIVLELRSGFKRASNQESKVQIGLLFGALGGFLVQSVFEAWWVAPGAAESAFFWATLGAAYGTIKRASAGQAVTLAYPRPRLRHKASPQSART